MSDISTSKDILEQADFDKVDGLLPAIIQDDETGKVLMLGYMNKKAVKQSFKSGRVTFYSRSRDRIWQKGEESGNFLAFKSAKLDCDNDALLIMAHPTGPVCHTGEDTCWSEHNTEKFGMIYQLEELIRDRKKNPVKDSYTNKLLDRGINKIAQKVGEEAVEVVIESKDSNDDLFKAEMSDLLYHLSVLLVTKDITWKEVMDTLRGRRK